MAVVYGIVKVVAFRGVGVNKSRYTTGYGYILMVYNKYPVVLRIQLYSCPGEPVEIQREMDNYCEVFGIMVIIPYYLCKLF